MSIKLNPTDAFFLQVERTASPMHIGSLVRLKLPEGRGVEYALELMNRFRSIPVSSSPFNYRLSTGVLGRWTPSWEIEEDIDMDYHLRHSALPQPGGERELAVLISRLHSIPLDRARPMWEMHLIEGLQDGTIAVYAKMHHALVDGMASVKLMQRSLSDKPAAESFVPMWALPAITKTRTASDPSGRREAFGKFVGQFGSQLAGIGRVTSSLTQVVRGARNKDLPHLVAPYSAPDCVLNGAIGPQRRVSTQDFALKDIKALAAASKGTLNDVVMAICGGALRNYLGELQALPNEPLVAQVPVSVRPKDQADGGNAISMLLTNLGTHLADPKARFDCIQNSLNDGKSLLKRMSRKEIDQYSALLMAPFALGQVSGIGNRSRKPMFNVVISNVPGPTQTMYVDEAEVLSVHPVSLVFEGQALNITIFSYAEKLSFVYTACRSSLPHLQTVIGHAQAAFDELCKLYGVAAEGLPVRDGPAPKSATKKAAPRKTAAKKPAPRKPATKATSAAATAKKRNTSKPTAAKRKATAASTAKASSSKATSRQKAS